jgi:nicotinamide phosphoribosyltransferase
MNPFYAVDGYKIFHHLMSPTGTSLIYSNLTPRSFKHFPWEIKTCVVFGTTMTFKEIVKQFDDYFFNLPKAEVCGEIKKAYSEYSGTDYDVSKIEALHDLGYLPISVKALPEGTEVSAGIPVLTIYNTLPEFCWVTNFLETMISNLLWKPMTSATIAREFKKLNDAWVDKTDKGNDFHKAYGCHDFSMRGLDSTYATMSSGLGHALYHQGSDSLPVIYAGKHYYGETTSVVNSIPATEHSIQCAYYHNGGDYAYLKTLIERFPTGPLGTVLDGFDLFKAITQDITRLKQQIKARTGGPLVLRPDSGNPVDIVAGELQIPDLTNIEYCKNLGACVAYMEDGIHDKMANDVPHGECGPDTHKEVFMFNKVVYEVFYKLSWNRHDKQYYYLDEIDSKAPVPLELCAEDLGVVELLWDIFGGTVNDQGFKVLDPCIRVIYGDSITLERFNEINERLAAKGFASTNWVAGVGSFTYQFNTRDTLGIAVKSTYQEVTIDGVTEGINIFKDPVTDDGTKKSAKGLLCVGKKSDGNYFLKDECSWNEPNEVGASEATGKLEQLFLNGEFYNIKTFTELRTTAHGNLAAA